MHTFKTKEGTMINIPSQLKCYEILEKIGSGSFGIVFKVKQCFSNKVFAAKVITQKKLTNENIKDTVNNEVTILRSIRHKNIIKCYDVFEITNEKDEKLKIIIEDYCSQGSLQDYVINNKFKDKNEKVRMMRDFIDAIAYLHDKNIAHCDIKVDNILIDDNFNIKLCDFGLSKNFNKKFNEIKCGTLAYAAPELKKKGKVDFFKSDIWAVGISLYARYLPYKNEKDIIQNKLSIGMKNKILENIIVKCLQFDPNMRTNARDILNEGFFSVNITQQINDSDENKVPNTIAIG